MIVDPSAHSKRANGAVAAGVPPFAPDPPLIFPAGPSTPALPPPPSFEESIAQPPPPDQALINIGADGVFIPPGGEEPPPAFAPYEAEYSLTADGVVSHDPHLNTDGEALYRFLLSHAATPPGYVLHISGMHEETHTRFVTRTDSDGNTYTDTDDYTEIVTDFDFNIDVGQYIIAAGPAAAPEVTHWSVADEQPAYRGGMKRKIGIPPDLQHPPKKVVKNAERWAKERERRGLPPWVGEDRREDDDESNPYSVLQSSWTLRQWADDYCASPKYLKEFVYERVVYGWNIDTLTGAVRAAVLSTHYTGELSIAFETSSHRICIRSADRLSRMLSNKWIKFLLIITLIYPFIALFRRYHRRGGGRWEVCGGAYALKAFADPPTADVLLADEDADPARSAVANNCLVRTRAGVKVLRGVREGEWYQRWEGTIRGAVQSRRRERTPITEPGSIVRFSELSGIPSLDTCLSFALRLLWHLLP